jgi:hypothetical protein
MCCAIRCEGLGQGAAIERLEQEAIGSGPFAGHHLLEFLFDHQVVDLHFLATLHLPNGGDEIQCASHPGVNKQHLGKLCITHDHCFASVRSFNDKIVQPRQDTFCNLANYGGIIGDHQATHGNSPLSCPWRAETPDHH